MVVMAVLCFIRVAYPHDNNIFHRSIRYFVMSCQQLQDFLVYRDKATGRVFSHKCWHAIHQFPVQFYLFAQFQLNHYKTAEMLNVFYILSYFVL